MWRSLETDMNQGKIVRGGIQGPKRSCRGQASVGRSHTMSKKKKCMYLPTLLYEQNVTQSEIF